MVLFIYRVRLWVSLGVYAQTLVGPVSGEEFGEALSGNLVPELGLIRDWPGASGWRFVVNDVELK
jgi:hypothetical protein